MLGGIGILTLATGSLVGLGALEAAFHRRNLRRIPHRIHVSGTRGKSSVTRLIAAGLRSGGVRTAAKTTGTLPRMILPDGKEVPVFRPRGANIIEQTRIVSLAAQLQAEALVLECMALQPYLHWLSENKMVRATHGVITNARADHLEVMGPGEEDVAKCLAGMIPVGGKLFTAERRHLDILKMAADDRGTKIISVDDDDLASVTDEQLDRFKYTEHRENLALALKVLEDLGVTPEQALPGMWSAQPDPGVLTEHVLDFFGRRVIFVNAFAANDPESTGRIWQMTRERHPDIRRVIGVFNMRADRPARTMQLARDATFWREADAIVLMGTGGYLFGRAAEEAGYDVASIIYAETGGVEDIFENIIGVCGKETLVIGMGNIGGQGLSLVRFFRNRSLLEPRESGPPIGPGPVPPAEATPSGAGGGDTTTLGGAGGGST